MANDVLKLPPKRGEVKSLDDFRKTDVHKSYEDLRKTDFYFKPAYIAGDYWHEFKIAPELITAYYTGIELETLEKIKKSGLVKQFFCTPDIRLAERYLTGEIEMAHLGPPPARIETRFHITGEVILVYDKGTLERDYFLGPGEKNANEYDIRRKEDPGGPTYGPNPFRDKAPDWGIPLDARYVREVIAYSDHAYQEASRMLQGSGIKVTRMNSERNAEFWRTEKYLQLGVTPEETETIYKARKLRFGWDVTSQDVDRATELLVNALKEREAAGIVGKIGKIESFLYSELAECLMRQMQDKVSREKVEMYEKEAERKTPGWSSKRTKEELERWERYAADKGMFDSKYSLSGEAQEKVIGKELIEDYRALISKAKELNPDNNLAAERPLPC